MTLRDTAPGWPPGSGEMARRVREHAWGATPLGPLEGWPERLKAAVEAVLANPNVASVAIGPDRLLVYNDAAARLYDDRHPRALGRPLAETWPEAHAVAAPIYTLAFAGQGVHLAAQPLDVSRVGGEVFDVTLLPVRGPDGAVLAVQMMGFEIGAKSRAESALRESEERRRLAAEAAQIGTWDFDVSTGTGQWDAAAVQIAGLPLTELQYDAESWLRLVHPDDRAWASDAFRASLAPDGPRYDVEFRCSVAAADGGPRWLSSQGAVFRDPTTQAAVRAVGILQDVTERHRREERLAAREGQLAAGLSAGRMVAWSLDLATGFIERSENAHDIFGPGSTAETFHARMPAEDVTADRSRLQAALEGRVTHYDSEFRYRHPDGRLLWLQNWGQVVRDDAGHPRRMHGVCMDLTERKEVELALRESETRHRLALEAAQAIVYDWDCRTDHVDRGGNLEGVVGFRPDEVPKDPRWWSERVHPDDRGRLISSDPSRIVPGVTRAEAEYRVRHRDGHWVHVLDRHVAIRDPDGVVRIVGSTVDVTARAEAEAALRDSEAVARARAEEIAALYAAAPVGLAVLDPELRYVRINARLAEMNGVPVADHIGRTVQEVVPDLGEQALATMRRVLAGEDVWGLEFTGTTPARPGVVRTWRENWLPLRDAAGAVRGITLSAEEVTEAKAAEVALRDLNETLEARVDAALAERKLLADVFEGTDAMIAVADRDLRLLAFNRRYAEEVEKLGGRRPKVGDSLAELYAGRPELADPVVANWTRAIAGEVFSVTEAHGDPARYARSYERRFEPIQDREGRLVGAYQYATDVTERLADQRRAAEAEAARRDADALYRAYFETSGEALFVVGVLPEGGFTFEQVNPAHRAALGFDIAAVPGRRVEEVLPPDVAAAVSAHYRRVVETGELQRYRESAELGGRVIHAETVLVPVRDETGRIVRIVGSGRDMTAQVQAEEALRQSQKMEAMGQLTGGVAHDFNNLLTPILGGLDRLQRKGVGDERDRQMIEGALQSAERAKTLVQRLLAFARRQPLQPGPVDLGRLVTEMAELIASTSGPRIDLRLDLPADLPPALADANQLEMALLNLAVNARDAMPDGGTLRISATEETVSTRGASGAGAPGHGAVPPARRAVPPGRYVRLSVADTGVGMDEATLSRAVEPFFSTKGVGRGTGLGLSMVHGLAAQLGGALTIQSAPGLGTNVELWLPVAEAVAEAAVGPAPSSSAEAVVARQAHGTALLVDDEPLVRATGADMLAELGYAVVEAGSADEALRRIDDGLAPDLVVTDHLMPGLTGTELARLLQAQRPGLPVLIVSGYADMDGVAPDLPRLTKPFRVADLAHSLSRLMRGRLD